MRGRRYWLLYLLTILTVALEPGAKGTVGRSIAVGFDLYRGYLIVVRGSAGPRKDLNFLLDTGVSYTVLDRRLARKLRLHELPGVLAGVNGRVAAGRAIAPSLQIGPARRENLSVMIEDLSCFDKALPVRIDAVIGLDVVGQGAFEIDYSSRRINFGPLPSLKNTLRLRMSGGLPLVDAELDETPVHLVLDTGASSLILFEPKTATQAKISAAEHSAKSMGEFEGKPVWLSSLKLGQAEFQQEAAFLVPRGGGIEDRDFDGLVSPALLGITKVAIDLDQGVVAFSR
ncbi:MAG: retropepsin-like aspartic protease [Acidobacteriaceae bacterium]